MSHKDNTRNNGRAQARTTGDRLTTVGMSTFSSAARALQLVRELIQLRSPGHQAGEFVAGDLALGQVAQTPTPVEHQETVADRIGVVRVVGDEDDAHPAVARLGDVPKDDAGLLDP